MFPSELKRQLKVAEMLLHVPVRLDRQDERAAGTPMWVLDNPRKHLRCEADAEFVKLGISSRQYLEQVCSTIGAVRELLGIALRYRSQHPPEVALLRLSYMVDESTDGVCQRARMPVEQRAIDVCHILAHLLVNAAKKLQDLVSTRVHVSYHEA